MPISISFNGSDEELISSFETKQQEVLTKIAERMTLGMQQLQEKAREKLRESKHSKYPENPKNPSTGALEESIENPRVDIEGENIIGRLDWGGDLPYAQIQEHGGALPVINAIGARKEFGRALGGTRKHVKGATRVFGADVLQFIGADGIFAYREATFPGVIPAKHFMEQALDEEIDEITAGIQSILDAS